MKVGPMPTPTPTPTQTSGTAEFGTVTLTDEGCTWDRNQTRIFGPRLLAIDVVNETDTFGNFRLYRLTTGYAWEDAAAWVIAENEAIQTNTLNPLGAADFAIEVASVDALAFEQSRLARNAEIRGTYGVLCSSNEPPPGEVFGVYLVGPLEIE